MKITFEMGIDIEYCDSGIFYTHIENIGFYLNLLNIEVDSRCILSLEQLTENFQNWICKQSKEDLFLWSEYEYKSEKREEYVFMKFLFSCIEYMKEKNYKLCRIKW